MVGPLARIGVTPNVVSIAGFAGNVTAAVFAASNYFLAAGVVMLAFSGLDLLDGALARKTGTVTGFGAVFDSVLDRLSEAAVIGGLLFHFNEVGGRTMEVSLSYAAIVGSIMVSYVRARAEGIGLELREGLFTRAERVLLLAGALILTPFTDDVVMLVALWLLAGLSLFTVGQRVFAIWRKLSEQTST